MYPFKSNNFRDRIGLFAAKIRNIGLACEQAKNELTVDRHDRIATLPEQLQDFKALTDALQAEGHNMQTLGPALAELFDETGRDWVAEDATYATLRAALVDLYLAITNNGTSLLHNYNASGQRIYDVPLSAPQKTALDGKLDAVLALYT